MVWKKWKALKSWKADLHLMGYLWNGSARLTLVHITAPDRHLVLACLQSQVMGPEALLRSGGRCVWMHLAFFGKWWDPVIWYWINYGWLINFENWLKLPQIAIVEYFSSFHHQISCFDEASRIRCRLHTLANLCAMLEDGLELQEMYPYYMAWRVRLRRVET